MSTEPKTQPYTSVEPQRQVYSSEFESDSNNDVAFVGNLKTLKLLESVRSSLSAMALVASIAILGVSADTLKTYQETHVSPEFNLPLWPNNFNIRPTVALVAGSTIVMLASAIGLAFGRVKVLRNNTVVTTAAVFAAPFIGLAAAIISIVYFYAVNASTSVDTVQSWSCRWRDVAMMTRPHFGTLCRESQAGLYLAILLIPIEAITLGVAAYEMAVKKAANSVGMRRKAASPSHG